MIFSTGLSSIGLFVLFIHLFFYSILKRTYSAADTVIGIPKAKKTLSGIVVANQSLWEPTVSTAVFFKPVSSLSLFDYFWS